MEEVGAAVEGGSAVGRGATIKEGRVVEGSDATSHSEPAAGGAGGSVVDSV